MSDPILELAADLARYALEAENRCSRFNHLPNIEWPYREKVRAIQGHFDKIDDLCSDLIWGVGTDTAADLAESIWGKAESLD